jgi:ketosteroid isomerase-like protein
MKPVKLAMALCLVAGVAQASDLKPTIGAANAKFSAAFNKGDAAALANFYTENATILPAGAPMAHGHAGVQKVWQGAIDSGLKNMALQAISVEQYGPNGAREIGRFSLDAPNAQKQMTHVEGKYVVIWKHQKNAWKLDTDIWNMNQ